MTKNLTFKQLALLDRIRTMSYGRRWHGELLHWGTAGTTTYAAFRRQAMLFERWGLVKRRTGRTGSQFIRITGLGIKATKTCAVQIKCQCCSRGDEYNGFASGPTIFTCPKGCICHD